MNSMASAIAKALELGLTPALINVCEWAKTYSASQDEFQTEWDKQLSERSLRPSNSFEVEGK